MIAQPKASHFIDGTYVEDTAGPAIDVIFPATGDPRATGAILSGNTASPFTAFSTKGPRTGISSPDTPWAARSQ